MTNPTLIHAPLHCDIGQKYRNAVAVIGNMDGVHRGHQALVSNTVALARQAGEQPAAVVFEPHPRRVFQPDAPPFQLTDLHTKQGLLEQLGISIIFVLPFMEELFTQTPKQFVHDTLKQRLGLSSIVTGSDFQFGAGRAGNVTALAELANQVGISAHAVEPVMADDEMKFSSSGVRAALQMGRPDQAQFMLGRPWSMRGPVIEGRKLARTLDFPTANIPLGDYIRPKFGVYVISVDTDQGTFTGVANIGVRPTVDGTHEILEAHLFDFDGDLYGQTIDVRLHHFLRAEQKFDGLPALQAQISKDSDVARAWHLGNPK